MVYDTMPKLPPQVEKQLLMLFMHFLMKCALQPKYFCLGRPVVNTEMSGSEMIANILLSFMPAGEQVTFAFFFLKVGDTAAVDLIW